MYDHETFASEFLSDINEDTGQTGRDESRGCKRMADEEHASAPSAKCTYNPLQLNSPSAYSLSQSTMMSPNSYPQLVGGFQDGVLQRVSTLTSQNMFLHHEVQRMKVFLQEVMSRMDDYQKLINILNDKISKMEQEPLKKTWSQLSFEKLF